LFCKSYENPALCTYISLQTPQMYAHSCITTFLLCNVSLDGAASTEADRKVVRSVSEREHILDCRLDDVNSSILCQNSAINKHNFEKRSMRKGYFEPASIPCAGHLYAPVHVWMFWYMCTFVQIETSPRGRLINDDAACSDMWWYSKLRGLSTRSIELARRKRYLQRATRITGIWKAMTSISAAIVCCDVFGMTGLQTGWWFLNNYF